MTKNRKVVGIVAGAIVLVGILAGGIAILVSNLNGHNWNLGLAPQQEGAAIAKVRQAVMAVDSDAILDVYVKNANSSGTPFGHSVTVKVLVDASKASSEEAIDAIAADVATAIRQVGVKDSYAVTIGLDVDPTITSGDGSAESPITTAERAGGGYSSHFFTLEVK